MTKIRIKKHERGLWFRHGDFRRVLGPGAHRFWSRLWSNKDRVDVFDTMKTKVEHPMLDLLLQHDHVRDALHVVDLTDVERALVWRDDRLAYVLGPGRHALWKEPYRLYVPTNWDGQAKLPLVMFLHGSGADENTYVDANSKQMVNLAQQHGYLLVAPLGDAGAYGNFLRLSSPFGKPDEAAKLIAAITPDSERTNELSEKDVINVLELVLAEYPVDRAAMFLTGHSMGSGGTWYIGGKYASYWKGLAPMSGPFVQETGYPWDSVRPIYLFVTEGTQAPSLDGSRVLRDWLTRNGFMSEYEEVNADHGGMVKLVLPDIFTFFDRTRSK